MSAPGSRRSHAKVGWVPVSLLLHALFVFGLPGRQLPERPLVELPTTMEFGLTQGAGDEGASPPPAGALSEPAEPVPIPPRPRASRVTPAVPVAEPAEPEAAATVASEEAGPNSAPEVGSPAALSGAGLFADAAGSGSGLHGSGTGSGPRGATIALNVDLERVRSSALLLETQALLDILPEWRLLFAGSGLDAVRDFRRVFVAAPSLDRAALIVSAEHRLSRTRIGSAVAALSAERGLPASFAERGGIPVAAWRNRGPTDRVIALPASDQLLITRSDELARVLNVAQSLRGLRTQQGFSQAEVDARGGLLAMQPDEAVALWVEGVRHYLRGGHAGAPASIRFSVFRIDQFHTELGVSANYASREAAEAAVGVVEELRRSLRDHPRVSFLGLTSAVDGAAIEPNGSALHLRAKLTLHQARYVLSYVKRLLRPAGAGR